MLATTQSEIDTRFLDLVEALSLRALGGATAKLHPYGEPAEPDEGGSDDRPETESEPEPEPEPKSD